MFDDTFMVAGAVAVGHDEIKAEQKELLDSGAVTALTLWEVILAALFLFLSRGVLHTCDMETMPGKKG